MKKWFIGGFILMLSLFIVTGCTDTNSTDEDGNKTRDFKFGETATVNDTKIKLNSVKKIMKECSFEWDGKCQSYTEPDNDYFLLIDLTIENTGDKDLSISSMMSFEIKDKEGNKGRYALLTNSIKSQLDGTVMPNDNLKGQIAFDVLDAETFNFYFLDSLLDSPIKFEINSSDITE